MSDGVLIPWDGWGCCLGDTEQAINWSVGGGAWVIRSMLLAGWGWCVGDTEHAIGRLGMVGG